MLDRYSVKTVPLYINFYTGESLRDGVECTPDDIFKSFETTKKTPKTAAPPPSDYEEMFKKVMEDGCDGIVHISINSEFSSSYQNAILAARQVSPNIRVVDARTLSSMQGLMVIRACEMAQSGAGLDEIANAMTEQRRKNNSDFILGGLDYAARGGRCPMLVALGANLLKIRPMMRIDEKGKISTPKKFRGAYIEAAKKYLDSLFENIENIDFSKVFISYTSFNAEVMKLVRERLASLPQKFEAVFEARTNCTVATHGGPETLAVFYYKKNLPEQKAKLGLPFIGRG
jgi:DegV family protein with EDD domain